MKRRGFLGTIMAGTLGFLVKNDPNEKYYKQKPIDQTPLPPPPIDYDPKTNTYDMDLCACSGIAYYPNEWEIQ